MPERGVFSGDFAVPVGSLDLFNKEDDAIDPSNPIVQNLTDPNVDIADESIWIRANAAGTKITGSGITVSRTAQGIYACTLTSAVASEAYGVVVTPSTESGNGGDGVTPLKAFSDVDAETTDAALSNFFKHPTEDTLYLIGSDADDVWIHDITIGVFPGTATQVDASADPIRATPYGGCLSKEGGYVWLSGDNAGPIPIRCMNTSTNTMTDFGTNIDAVLCAATDTSIWVMGGGNLTKYTPNIGGASLGAAQLTYTGLDLLSNGVPATWDDDGYFWVSQGGYFYQVDPNSADWARHQYPQDLGGPPGGAGNPGGATRCCFDSYRRRFYVSLASNPNYIYQYSNWANGVDDSGVWEQILNLGTDFKSIWYDNASGVLFVADYSLGRVMRYVGDPFVLVDELVHDYPSGDIPYDTSSPYTCWYDRAGYGYVQGTIGGTKYIVRISYQGAELSTSGGTSFLSSVLVGMYEITGNSTFNVHLFRSLSPIIRADGEFTAIVAT